MVTGNLDNEIVVLYDMLHELYVDSIKFQDACPMNEGVKRISKLHNVMDSVNNCMVAIAFEGMGLIEFIDDVNLNDLYTNVLFIASEVQNVAPDMVKNNDDLLELQRKIHTNVNKIHAIIQDIMQILVEVLNA